MAEIEDAVRCTERVECDGCGEPTTCGYTVKPTISGDDWEHLHYADEWDHRATVKIGSVAITPVIYISAILLNGDPIPPYFGAISDVVIGRARLWGGMHGIAESQR